MKYISILIVVLITSGCSNLDLATIYSPKELEFKQSRNLEGLNFKQLKANPLKSHSIIYTSNMGTRDLYIDDNHLQFGFTVGRKIVISPGKHKLKAKIVVGYDWPPYKTFMNKLGFYYEYADYDPRIGWWRNKNATKDDWTWNGFWDSPEKLKDAEGNLLDIEQFNKILKKKAFMMPVSIEFTTEAGKVYSLPDLVSNVTFNLNGVETY